MRKKLAIILSLIFLFFSFLLIDIKLVGEGKINIATNKQIQRGMGWKNNNSYYSGSELNFIFIKSREIAFEFDTNSKADQGAEIFVDGKVYSLSSPNLESQRLLIKVDKKKTHTVTVRHFCTYTYHRCQIAIKGVFLDRGAKILPYRLHNKVLSVFGDSISTMYGKNNYSYLLAQELEYELHNASILESTVTERKGANSAVLRYKKDLMSFKSDVVIIFLGTNDAGSDVPLDIFEKDYSKIISDLKKYNPEGKVFLVGVLPREDIDYAILEQYNAVIKRIADSYNLNYIDPSSWLTENDFSDAIHPSVEGHKKIEDQLTAILSPLLN